MARIRTIKPEFWSSLTVARLSPEARLTFIGLWNYVDDYGRAINDKRLIKAAIWPLDDRATPKRIARWMGELVANSLIAEYVADGRDYLYVMNWAEHQRVEKPRNSAFPPPSSGDSSPKPPRKRPESSSESAAGKEGKGKEEEGKGKGIPAAGSPPQTTPAGGGNGVTVGREPDPCYEAFAAAYADFYEGVPYAHQKADFVQLAAARKNFGDKLDVAGWGAAVGNYFATPRSKHTLADLACNYATFRKHALDQYGKPVTASTALAVRGGVTVDRKSAELIDVGERFLQRHGVKPK